MATNTEHKINKRRLNEFKRHHKHSEEGRWHCARLTWEAIDRDGESGADWAVALGYSEVYINNFRSAWKVFGTERIDGLTFTDHLTLAKVAPARRKQMMEEAKFEGISVGSLVAKKSRAKREIKIVEKSEKRGAEKERLKIVEMATSNAMSLCEATINSINWADSNVKTASNRFEEAIQDTPDADEVKMLIKVSQRLCANAESFAERVLEYTRLGANTPTIVANKEEV